MAKHLITFILSTSVIMQAYAQEIDRTLAAVKYEFIHVNDTNDRNNPKKQGMILYLGQQGSLYKSYNSESNAAEFIAQLERLGVPASDVKIKSSYTEEILTSTTTDGLTIIDYINSTPFWMPDIPQDIQWSIHDESKEIGGYPVQKASANFRGREYTAWFTTALPFPFGPWKLRGLPGLILEAEDHEEEVLFRYISFEKVEEEEVTIALPENAVKTTSQAFAKAKDAIQSNPTASSAANNNQRSSFMRMQNGKAELYTGTEAQEMFQKSYEKGKLKNNNPIELTK